MSRIARTGLARLGARVGVTALLVTPIACADDVGSTSTVPPTPGRLIAFVSERDGNPEVYVMDASGGDERRLTSDPGDDTSPAWSPDARRLAFVSDRGGGPDVYVVGVDGTGLARLTDNPGFDVDPVWSPDGRWIAYLSSPGGFEGAGIMPPELFVVRQDGTDRRQLTRNESEPDAPTEGTNASDAAWSPDGERIAFAADVGANPGWEVYVVALDGAPMVRLTDGIGDDDSVAFEPVWSPDGRRIDCRVETRDRTMLYSVEVATGAASLLADLPVTHSSDPVVWSADRSSVAFVREAVSGASDVWVMPLGGGPPTRVSNGDAAGDRPTWMPDGSRLAYAAVVDGDVEIVSVTRAGTEALRLTEAAGADWDATWSP